MLRSAQAWAHRAGLTGDPPPERYDAGAARTLHDLDLLDTAALGLPDDSREPDGKTLMRKGMSRYLGVHSEYQAEMIDYQYGYNAVSIKHTFSAKGKRADGSEFSYSKVALDVLELENGKVSVIRRYSE